MKRVVGLMIMTAALATAQTQGTITGGGKSATVTLRPRTIVSALTCDMDVMEPGETTLCTLTINQAARKGGFAVTVQATAPLTAPALAMVSMGATTATFTVSYPNSATGASANALPIIPARFWMYGDDIATTHVAAVMVPCCARADRCGLPADQIATTPCE